MAGSMLGSDFCRDQALVEPLAGTGNDAVSRWILVEDCEPWGPKVPRDCQLPDATRDWLIARNAEPGTRVQLIRQPGSSAGPRRKVFICEALAKPSQRRLVELESRPDEIPDLDLDALLARAPALEPSDQLAMLWLVCTHGVRDRCCAKWGVALWEALRRHDPERVWQCSHLGGHRFAPTFLTLPSGLLWGRFELDDLDQLRASLSDGRLASLDRLRGRGCYPRVIQAAECFARAREGLLDERALTLVESEELPDGAHRVRFELGSGQIEVIVERAAIGHSTPGSCGDPLEARIHYCERPVFES